MGGRSINSHQDMSDSDEEVVSDFMSLMLDEVAQAQVRLLCRAFVWRVALHFLKLAHDGSPDSISRYNRASKTLIYVVLLTLSLSLIHI